ncbi:hypothetical protein CP97_04740 [Aurantiacibacter atlanticus]|uniref:DUF481 domain-containing protein n=1 Tax=Aurantiacibacter atlanticus TaxID=1648404 RepID=A0A0H4VF66_9SPHN|nr:hypothetical protein [Aurantiacibacter atlanticus]AKQ41486.1 hypothetical protein CP97_04740 [Aurantiacibacter atlanticus]
MTLLINKGSRHLTALSFMLGLCSPAAAQTSAIDEEAQSRPAAGTQVWASSDSDGTEVLKIMGRALWSLEDRQTYAGIAVEYAHFSPASGEDEVDERVYFDLADHLGPDWRWRARIGTDGHTVLGSAEIRRADWAQSLFVEREIVETEQGLANRIYYTFVGASSDFQIDDANSFSLTAGVQEFTGKNERLHLRGRLVHTLKAEAGLSGHLDVRYYHSTAPREFDYFSPRDFVRVVPLLQLRRFNQDGWMFLAAGGFGAQHSSGAGWSAAKSGQLRLESPQMRRDINIFAELIYTNDSISGGTDYDYVMGRAGLTIGF